MDPLHLGSIGYFFPRGLIEGTVTAIRSYRPESKERRKTG
jgi:hypothetical protein